MRRNISDTNIPMNIKDDGKIIKKYSSRKLKTIPTELQKYNEYLTKSKPILDEANYVASRRKDKKMKKKEEDFEFIEDLKDKRRQKQASAAEKRRDMTPLILTDLELTNPKTDLFSTLEGIFPTASQTDIEATKKLQGAIRAKLARDENASSAKQEIENEAISKIQAGIRGKIAREGKRRNEIDKAFEEARKEVEKEQAIKTLQGAIRRREIEPLYQLGKEVAKQTKEEEAASKIEKAILGKVKRERAKKIQKGLEEQIAKNEVNKYGGEILPESRLIKALKKKQEKNEFFEIGRGEPELVKRGRPVGSKNKK